MNPNNVVYNTSPPQATATQPPLKRRYIENDPTVGYGVQWAQQNLQPRDLVSSFQRANPVPSTRMRKDPITGDKTKTNEFASTILVTSPVVYVRPANRPNQASVKDSKWAGILYGDPTIQKYGFAQLPAINRICLPCGVNNCPRTVCEGLPYCRAHTYEHLKLMSVGNNLAYVGPTDLPVGSRIELIIPGSEAKVQPTSKFSAEPSNFLLHKPTGSGAIGGANQTITKDMPFDIRGDRIKKLSFLRARHLLYRLMHTTDSVDQTYNVKVVATEDANGNINVTHLETILPVARGDYLRIETMPPSSGFMDVLTPRQLGIPTHPNDLDDPLLHIKTILVDRRIKSNFRRGLGLNSFNPDPDEGPEGISVPNIATTGFIGTKRKTTEEEPAPSTPGTQSPSGAPEPPSPDQAPNHEDHYDDADIDEGNVPIPSSSPPVPVPSAAASIPIPQPSSAYVKIPPMTRAMKRREEDIGVPPEPFLALPNPSHVQVKQKKLDKGNGK